ncbi:hypothetical protein OH77DRAFT_1423341 [Trametes cingulata]|nr:hypothetical protein OH77DRAFT_1423341 [Trametes cingulata]
MARSSRQSPDTDYGFGNDDRPTKRRRTSPAPSTGYVPTFQQIILEEIDLEVAIRQRIAETVQSRITWALLLQESLEKGSTSRSEDFRSASLDALDAIEAPCDLIFNREVRLAPPPLRPVVNATPSSSKFSPSEPPVASTSTLSRSSRTRGLPRAAPTPRERLLYIRNTATDPPEVAKLACPVCARSDFSSLQGLLNHCRLRHQIEYGSHDECVQSCAVLVPEGERDWVVAAGVEVGGVSLPSLRRLFEIAVGAGERVTLPIRKPSPAPPVQAAPVQQETAAPATVQEVKEEPRQEPPQTSAHVTKTLGYHADTPALAPFLGRAPKKRCINVRANEDDPVDIEDTAGGSGLQHRHIWRKPYAHRNVARKELDEVVPLSELPNNAPTEPADESQKEGKVDEPESKRSAALELLSGTRFHINARVQVADYSLFIPPNRRPAELQDHTHRWRLAVTSPSYSLPIASVLRKLTVSCVTEPPPSTLAEPITVSEPPFVVTSTSDKPFLARLMFTWAGSMNPPTEIEHWVELDPMHYAQPVLGDEQVFDVELDRSTELLPVRDDIKDISLDDMHIAQTAAEAVKAEEPEEVAAEPDYSVKLRTLLPQFPMTMKDVKGRFSSRLPYTLVSTPAQLRSMHFGRRKAIEMARARALRDAYSQLVAEQQDADAISLTTVDVYHWLEDEGLYPRSSPTAAQLASQKQAKSSRRQRGAGALDADAFCRTCGLHRAYHPSVADEDTKPIVDIKPSALGAALERGLCMSFNGEGGEPTRTPVFDVHALLKYAPTDAATPVPYGLGRAIFAEPAASRGQAVSPSPSDLVSVADPQLVVAIQRLTGLPQLHDAPADDPLRTGVSSLTSLTRSQAAAHLAPSALLAVLLKPLVRQLVGRGVDTLRQDEAALRVATGRHERARRATAVTAGVARRVLAPAHVLRGVAAHARTGSGTAGSVLRVCLGRLGERSAVLECDPTDGALHIGEGPVTTREGRARQATGEDEGEKVSAILHRPGRDLPEGVVVKAEEV